MGEITVRGDWSPQQRIFQAWLASPERIPPTQGELAAQFGLAPARLSEWKQLPGWDDAVYELTGQMIRQYVPALLKAGYRHALNGKYSYWAALMRMAGFNVDGNTATDSRTQIAIVFGDGAGVNVHDFTVQRLDDGRAKGESVTYENYSSQSLQGESSTDVLAGEGWTVDGKAGEEWQVAGGEGGEE